MVVGIADVVRDVTGDVTSGKSAVVTAVESNSAHKPLIIIICSPSTLMIRVVWLMHENFTSAINYALVCLMFTNQENAQNQNGHSAPIGHRQPLILLPCIFKKYICIRLIWLLWWLQRQHYQLRRCTLKLRKQHTDTKQISSYQMKRRK